ncbi:MAG: outer membrane beta-barrel protein [Bacteroidales bacterium]|nr:outer membrane beta-barrel protein [Bacteroidales bacterium]
MKKIFTVLLIVVFAASFANAQDYKPAAGKVTVELNFTPLSATPVGINYLKGRYFISEDLAFRLGVDIRMHNDKSEPDNAVDPDVKDEQKMSFTQFGLFPGIEKHFGGTDRVSPYIGAEVGFTTKGAKSEYTDNKANTTAEVEGAWDVAGTNRGFTTFGLNVLAGVDFYFVKKFYMGAELGFGVQSTSLKEVKATAGGTTNTVANKETSMDVGFNFNPAIRLGFCF